MEPRNPGFLYRSETQANVQIVCSVMYKSEENFPSPSNLLIVSQASGNKS